MSNVGLTGVYKDRRIFAIAPSKFGGLSYNFPLWSVRSGIFPPSSCVEVGMLRCCSTSFSNSLEHLLCMVPRFIASPSCLGFHAPERQPKPKIQNRSGCLSIPVNEP